MGLLDGLLGNASTLDADAARKELGVVLDQEEEVLLAYKLIRDILVLTDRRLIEVDRQGVMGSKVKYSSVPYRSIGRFSVESAGTFDLDAELAIWVTGRPEPLQYRFNKHVNVYELQRVLAEKVARPG